MKRIPIALKAFILVLTKKDVSLTLKYGKKELEFEDGEFEKTTAFLKTIQKRNDFPDHVLSQYKAVLNDYNYKH